MSCIFCKIINGELPSNIIYHDEHVIAIDDIHPKAPIHKLIIPRQHIATLNDLTNEEQSLVGHIILVAKKIATDLEIAEKGYRVLFNCNGDAGQVVFHLHLHLLGGRKLAWA